MTHLITPPPELIEQWRKDMTSYEVDIVRAAQWGADQELEACCEWVENECGNEGWGFHTLPAELRAARRPKPPSLKEQGLQALGRFNATAHTTASEMIADFDTIRRALEALPDD
jgi:hypothetical protein